MLGSVVGQADTFQLQSDLELRKQLRQYRTSDLNGGIDTNLINPSDRHALTLKLQAQDDVFQQFTQNNPNTYSVVLDSGASCTAINNANMLVDGSLRKLDKPFMLDGIAGGQLVEYC